MYEMRIERLHCVRDKPRAYIAYYIAYFASWRWQLHTIGTSSLVRRSLNAYLRWFFVWVADTIFEVKYVAVGFYMMVESTTSNFSAGRPIRTDMHIHIFLQWNDNTTKFAQHSTSKRSQLYLFIRTKWNLSPLWRLAAHHNCNGMCFAEGVGNADVNYHWKFCDICAYSDRTIRLSTICSSQLSRFRALCEMARLGSALLPSLMRERVFCLARLTGYNINMTRKYYVYVYMSLQTFEMNVIVRHNILQCAAYHFLNLNGSVYMFLLSERSGNALE